MPKHPIRSQVLSYLISTSFFSHSQLFTLHIQQSYLPLYEICFSLLGASTYIAPLDSENQSLSSHQCLLWLALLKFLLLLSSVIFMLTVLVNLLTAWLPTFSHVQIFMLTQPWQKTFQSMNARKFSCSRKLIRCLRLEVQWSLICSRSLGFYQAGHIPNDFFSYKK